ncbi:hypothetical protein [Nitratireductor sp. XY-223]|uniref:hypothetical protein n=1 Tax=Nitratireductor sp. XY-223 TaxID=2561926 RepID=UPI0010A9A27D|nr:hypothetical protein [Nitratireductor sp. XY-223]
MNRIEEVLGLRQDDNPLRDMFLRWQCRVRQISMREMQGRPDAGIIAQATPDGADRPLGDIITVFNRIPAYSRTPEFKHMFLKTHDPAQRRDKALQFFSETYFQKHREFSDILTATFMPASPGARQLVAASRCDLVFDAFGQRFTLDCRTRELGRGEPLYQATYWHNLLFNPNLNPDTTILAFAPQWDRCSADPQPAGG